MPDPGNSGGNPGNPGGDVEQKPDSELPDPDVTTPSTPDVDVELKASDVISSEGENETSIII